MQSPRDLHAQRQQALIDVIGSQYAEACPGSGKTWVIMGRYARRVAEEPRKGIALVSFTNAAIKEINDRSRGNPGLLRSPNFVGTFDGFIHRFIVTPGFTIKYGRRPRYCESWSQLDRDEVRSSVDYLRLDELLFNERGDPSINWSIIEDRRKPGIQGKEALLRGQAAARA
jgi:DNA helicase-2/ATP-dependent DNA helicase PcrA